MAQKPEIPEAPEGGVMRRLPIIIGALVLLGIGWFLVGQMSSTTGVKVEAPPAVAVQMLPPPPPPPPPPPLPHPPEPQDKPNPVPNPEPKPAPAPAAITINGPAQAGTDAFGLQSGSGGGTGGTGACTGSFCGSGGGGTVMSEVFYRRYLSAILQEKVQRDDRINRLVFAADFAVTISPGGRITEATVLKSSGHADRDQELRAVLMAVSDLDPPPGTVHFPQRITVRGKRSI